MYVDTIQIIDSLTAMLEKKGYELVSVSKAPVTNCAIPQPLSPTMLETICFTPTFKAYEVLEATLSDQGCCYCM